MVPQWRPAIDALDIRGIPRLARTGLWLERPRQLKEDTPEENGRGYQIHSSLSPGPVFPAATVAGLRVMEYAGLPGGYIFTPREQGCDVQEITSTRWCFAPTCTETALECESPPSALK